jgi:hypothetical protein
MKLKLRIEDLRMKLQKGLLKSYNVTIQILCNSPKRRSRRKLLGKVAICDLPFPAVFGLLHRLLNKQVTQVSNKVNSV